jgi:hypothetical protein
LKQNVACWDSLLGEKMELVSSVEAGVAGNCCGDDGCLRIGGDSRPEALDHPESERLMLNALAGMSTASSEGMILDKPKSAMTHEPAHWS